MSPKVKLYDKLPWTQGLVLDLPLYLAQEGSAGKVLDRTRYHNNGIVTGALWTPQGRTFDGNDYILIPNHTAFQGQTALTIAAWLYTVLDDFQFALQKGANVWALQARGDIAGNPYMFQFTSTDDYAYSVISITDSTLAQWDFVVGTYESSSGLQTLHVNGQQENTDTIVEKPLIKLDTSNIYIGARLTLDIRFWNGRIGEFLIYNRALTPAEIMNLYLATKWRYGL